MSTAASTRDLYTDYQCDRIIHPCCDYERTALQTQDKTEQELITHEDKKKLCPIEAMDFSCQAFAACVKDRPDDYCLRDTPVSVYCVASRVSQHGM